MKKLIFIGVLGLFIIGSCTNKNTDQDNKNAITHAHDEQEEKDLHEKTHPGEDEHSDAEEGAAHNDEHGGDDHGDEIILPHDKADAAGVKVQTIKPTPFQQVIKTGGQVLAAQGDESVAVATVAGVVSFRGKVTEGMSVSNGTPLITISSKNIADGDPVQRARVDYEVSKKEYERMKELVKSKIVSDKDFTQAEQNYENARISYEALAKNHSASGQNIMAPISGFVKSILVNEGDYVTIGQPLVSVTQNRRLFLRAEVSEKYYQYLRTISSANFKTPYNNQVYQLQDLSGKLLSYGKASGDNSFYIPVTFEFDNKVDVIPGSFVEVYLLSSPLENVISLPRTALTEEQGICFVYIQLDEEGYKKQEVTLGADNGKSVQILKGVKPGDKVVVEGAYQVRLASASNAIPAHTHEH